ncbi:unannotated protein [freshwater metagenome]|uniref:Unannotated protein n=1 Tax=freshwater metagenome TaxID=449393 RepID=A0A6J7G686_9ZZZZ|nr:hypothetical protein [Actinomycetota bacterium]
MRRLLAPLAALAAVVSPLAMVGATTPVEAVGSQVALGTGTAKVFAIDGQLYYASTGTYTRAWTTPVTSIQVGDVQVRRFLPKSGVDATFAPNVSLDITTSPQSGTFLGAPKILPVKSGLLFCRVNSSSVDSGRNWWLETALFDTAKNSWGSLRYVKINPVFGSDAGCIGAAAHGDGYTAIVGRGNGFSPGQSMYAVTYSIGSTPTISPITNGFGAALGDGATGYSVISVNAATGMTDLYLEKKIPVTFTVSNVLRGTRIVRVSRSYFVTYDVARMLWDTPVETFRSRMDADENVVGDVEVGGNAVLVAADGKSMTVINGYKRILSVPQRTSVPGTSLSRIDPANLRYQRIWNLGLSTADLKRPDWSVPGGWTLTYKDNSGTHSEKVTIFGIRTGALSLYTVTGPIVPLVGSATNIRLSFTGNTNDWETHELNWTRTVETVEIGNTARTFVSGKLGSPVKLAGVETGNGYRNTQVFATAVIDGVPTVINREAGAASGAVYSAQSLVDAKWSKPQSVLDRVDTFALADPILFMPYGTKTALIGIQGLDYIAPRAKFTAGVLRRVFSNGVWSDPELLSRYVPHAEIGVPAYASVMGRSGEVDVRIATAHPTVIITGVSFSASRLPGSSFPSTNIYTFSGAIPARAHGRVNIWGWPNALDWALSGSSPVINASGRTIKLPSLFATLPATPAPTTTATMEWIDMLISTYVVNP